MADEGGNMISRAVPTLSKKPAELAIQLESLLTQHYKDIKNLFEMTTDTDLQEQHRRERESR